MCLDHPFPINRVCPKHQLTLARRLPAAHCLILGYCGCYRGVARAASEIGYPACLDDVLRPRFTLSSQRDGDTVGLARYLPLMSLTQLSYRLRRWVP